jgi:hypothetical protein
VDPEAVMVTEPLFPPKQLTFACAVIEAVSPERSTIEIVVVFVQPFASFTVTVYEPAASEVKVAEAWKVVPLIEYVYEGVPLAPVAVIDPLAAPQVASALVADTVTKEGSVMETGTVVVQLFASVTVTV